MKRAPAGLRAAPGIVAPPSQMGAATGILLAGLLLTAVALPEGNPRETFTLAAQGTAIALGLSLLVEVQGGLRGLLRTDIVMLLTLFLLTFVEFLVPQKDMFDIALSPEAAVTGSHAVLCGFGGIVIGRHFFSARQRIGRIALSRDLPPRTMFTLFLAAAFLGYLHILLAVNFDIFEAMRQMALPRFSQSWGRGRFGGWADLLYELGALIYLIPPLAGAIYAQRHRYSMAQKAVVLAGFLFTLYYGFAGGTRNVFGIYMITFVGAYLALQPRITIRTLVTFALPASAVAFIGMYYMLEFRNMGLSNYSFEESEFTGIFVDSNLAVISKLTELFPRVYDYLSLEIPYAAIIRPIPRAIWPGKPEGLSVGIEDALGVSGLTLASTFVGETFMAGGLFGVLLAALFFGACAGKWNQMGRDLSSNYKLILFVSGFFAAALSMRSMLSAAPTILPTVALWVYGKYWLRLN